jgi:hypothetical protein
VIRLVLLVEIAHAFLDHPRAKIQRVRHESFAQNSARPVEAVTDEDFAGRQEAVEDITDGLRDVAELDAEGDEDAQGEDGDEELEGVQGAERAVGAVEEEDDEGVGRGEDAASDEGDLRGEDVDCDGCANDLGRVRIFSNFNLVWIFLSKSSRIA